MSTSVAAFDLTPSQLATLDTEIQDPSQYELINPATGELSERYAARLSPEQQDYVWKLAQDPDTESLAYAIATCNMRGVVREYCDRDEFARADPILCHDKLSQCCGKARACLGRWLRTHRHGRIVSVPHLQIELTIPAQGPLDPVPAQLTPTEVTRNRTRMARLAVKLFRGRDALVGDWLDPNNPSTTRLHAIATLASMQHADLEAEWKAIAGPLARAYVNFIRSGTETSQALEWVFQGCEPVHPLPGFYRAELRQLLKRAHLIRAYGTHYAPMTEEEYAARESEAVALALHTCPVCRDSHPLTQIPYEQRYQQRQLDIDGRYRQVEWVSDAVLLARLRPKRLNHKGSLSDKSSGLNASSLESARAGPI